MLHKVRGIVLRTTRYGDTSIVVQVYTDVFGLQGYIVNGVRTVKGKGKASLYQHGNLLEMVVYHKEQGGLMRVSECAFAHIYEQLPFQVVKGGLLLFYIEILNKIIREGEAQPDLFDFVFESFIDLDQTDKKISAHPIWFLLGMTKYLGAYPHYSDGCYFDLQDGVFTDHIPPHLLYLDQAQTQSLRYCLEPELRNYDQLNLTTSNRKKLLHSLISYYKHHVSDFGEIKSLDVLEGLFR